MRTFIKLLTIILIGLVVSCNTDKKDQTNSRIAYRIIDNSYLLTESQKDSIETLIKKLEQEIGSQIAILTVDTLETEKLEDFSFRMAEELRLGRSTHNDGLLITIVTMERKMRIEVGTGLENIIKDEIAGRIIQDDMAPSPDYAYIENNGQQIIHDISKIQQIDYQIFGKTKDDDYFSYDILKNELIKFKYENELIADKKLELINISEFYSDKKSETTGFSLIIVGVISLIASVTIVYMLIKLIVGYLNFR